MNRPTAATRSALSGAILTAFFLSGAAALVYQVLWTRRLGLVLGVTVQAASTVLACFMAGLAIGSYLAGRYSDHVRNPLKAFAFIELAIAVAGFGSSFALAAVDSLFAWLAPSLPDTLAVQTLVRVLLSASVLIVPAALMGATYPLVLQASSRLPDGLRRGASLLYGVNTAGAIAGVLLGSLWLVPTLGIRVSFGVAAMTNLLVAVLGWIAARRFHVSTVVSAPADATPARVTVPTTPASRRAVLIVIALSGVVSLSLEIIWFRVLVFFLRPTTYAFASMLATVLIGLAAGSLLVTPFLKRRANWLAVLGGLEILIGLTALVSSFLLVRSYDLMEWMWTWTWMPRPYDFVLPLMASAGMAILPTSMLLGAAFPLGLVLWTEPHDGEARATGRHVGVLYAMNVGGAIVGSFLAGFALLPWLGAQVSLIVVSAIPMIGGAVLLWQARTRAGRTGVVLGALVFVILAASLPDLFRDVTLRRHVGSEVLWHREDAQAAVSVITIGGHSTLLIDGMHHASDGAGMVGGHAAIGALGLAVHPRPQRILVVGLGGGATAGAASVLPSAFTEVVELSPSVIAAAPWFERTNRHVWRNPRVRFRVDDGRNYLLKSPGRFDIITADLLLPEMAGAANLYSSDYYRLAQRALAPGGIMVQWLDVGHGERYRLLLRSFAAVFPYVSVWQAGGIVIGSNEPIRLSRAAFEEKLRHPAARDVFDSVGFTSFDAVLDAYVGSEREVLRYVGEGELLTDDRPTIEYFLSMPWSGPADIGSLHGDRRDIAPIGDTGPDPS